MSTERALIAVAILVAGWFGAKHIKIPKRQPASTTAPAHLEFTDNVGDAIKQLRLNTRADVYKELDVNSQELLVNLVREHCSRKFEAPSCLHYAIACGRPCLAYLNKKERLRMLASYKQSNSKGRTR